MPEILDALQKVKAGDTLGWVMLLVGILLCFFEFTKIKVSPISAIFKWIGSRMNGELIRRMDEQDKKLSDVVKTIDENEIDRIRWEILDFANSCRNKRRHTKDEFEHIIEINAKYHSILDRHNMVNGIVDLEYSYIVRLYQKCQEKNSFLESTDEEKGE